MTRTEIETKRKANFNKIEELKRENIELAKQGVLLSDDEQWFTEAIESHPKPKYSRHAHYLDGRLVGRIHWDQVFEDESGGKPITIRRSEVVRVDGKWKI